MSNARPSGPLYVAVERFREYDRLQRAAHRAEQEMLAAVAQLVADGTIEERAEYARLIQQILDESERVR